MRSENTEQSKQIANLEDDLKIESTGRREASTKLSDALERERARLYDLVSVTVQTEPLVYDVSTQTDFIVPPVSLSKLLL